MKLNSFALLCLVITLCTMTLPSCATSDPTLTDCEQLRLSPIADINLIEETRIYLPIAVLGSNLEDIKFSLAKDHSFISIHPTQRGRAVVTADPKASDLGQFNITIEATDGSRTACVSFAINVNTKPTSGRIIHCDPNQKTEGNGSEDQPYRSLGRLIAKGFIPQENDLIILHNGYHGDVVLSGEGYNVVARNSNQARLSSLIIENAKNVNIKGLEIKPNNEDGDHDEYLVLIDSTCTKIDLRHNKVASTDDASQWNLADWNNKASRGIKCRASNCSIQNNLVQNIFHGIKTEGNNITVDYNHVDRFSGDAIRNTGSNNTYRSNFLTNATVDDYYDEKGNHDDLFQSWTFDKEIDSITLIDNILISCVDTLMPLRAKIVQGLVCFDGFTTNWKVTKNLVVTDHPHGISLYGAKNCIIENNLVLKNPNNLYHYESDPWIMVNNHKDGRKSTNNTVRNNTTSALNIVSEDVSISKNTIIDSSLTQKIYNYDQWDFRIKE